MICSTVFVICTGTIVAKVMRPEMEVTRAAEAVNNMLSTIIGALVGFISGQHYGRNEQLKKDFPTEHKTTNKKGQ